MKPIYIHIYSTIVVVTMLSAVVYVFTHDSNFEKEIKTLSKHKDINSTKAKDANKSKD